MLVLVAGFAVACGDTSSPAPIHASMDPLPVVTQPSSPPAKSVLDMAKRIDVVANQLDIYDPTRARTAITTIHAMPSWKRAIAVTHDAYKPFEPARLDEVSVAFAKSVSVMHRAARSLRDGHIADGVASFDTTVTALYGKPLRDLRSDLVDELVFDRDEACKHVTCRGVAEISAELENIKALSILLHAALTAGAKSIEEELGTTIDQHTQVVLSRARGVGPAFGETCGPEALCDSTNTCMAKTQTCEMTCFLGAESPCGPGLQCLPVPALEGTYCRH